ncbi:MAG: sialidase family protein, partial [Candidatus Thorarchaeota archaeon]
MIGGVDDTSNQRVIPSEYCRFLYASVAKEAGTVGMNTAFKMHCTLLVMLLLISFVPTASGTSTFPQESVEIVAFSPNVLLSTDDSNYDHHVEVSVAISDNGTIFAGWKNSDTHNGPGARVSIAKSVDGGLTWTQPFDMPMFGGEFSQQSDPWLYWHEGSLYYAYLEFEPDYFTDTSNPEFFTQITVAKSSDYGGTWTPVKASNGSYFADKETMMVGDDGSVYVVYDDVIVDEEDGNTTIRFTRSIDGGTTYDEISVIGEDPGYVGPFVAQNSTGGLFVAWTWLDNTFVEGALFLSRSTDDGETWDEPRLIDSGGNFSAATAPGGRPGKTTLPVLRFDDNDRLYVLWADLYESESHSWDVYLCYSDDSGETWSSRIQVNQETSGNQWNPDMVIDAGGRLHVAYYDERNDVYAPLYRSIEFTGIDRNNPVLSDEVPIANAVTISWYTRPGEYLGIQVDDDGIPHVAWSDARGNEMDIY